MIRTHQIIKNFHSAMFIIVLVISVCVLSQSVEAEPYSQTGDVELRHDLEYLADRGLISVPITTWPMSWADIASAVDSVKLPPNTLGGTYDVLKRLQSRVAHNTRWDEYRTYVSAAGIDNRSRLRVFDDLPRGSVELQAGVDLTTSAFAAKLNLSVVNDSDDKQSLRLDGSYVGYILGNTGITIGAQDSWWGPGHAGSLILSNNARPVPGIAFRRNVSYPFITPWLRWLGPWTAQAFFAQLESGRAVPEAKFLGARVVVKPLRSLELGVSRTAQWGGEGRPDSFRSLVNLIIGRDNVGDNGITRDDEPGNQMAGFDARYSTRIGGLPATIYSQLIGEDEAGGFPSRYLGLAGFSTSFALPWHDSTVRLNLEYSDTTCQFYKSTKLFNCAYNNTLYPTGYRHRGNNIGHSTDNDSSQLILIATLNASHQQSWQAVVRSGRINRGGSVDPRNSLSPQRVDVTEFDVQHSRTFYQGKLELGVGYQRWEPFGSSEATDSQVRSFLRWTSGR